MALVGYEAQKAKINAAIAEIQAQLGHRGPGRPRVAADGAAPAKRVMSAAARRRIAAAQRKLSAAGRKAIIEATRKRWAAYRKVSGKKKPTAKARKAAVAAAS